MTVFNLTEIEKKAYRSTFQDGLWDIFLGSQLLILSMSVLLSNMGLTKKLHMGLLIILQVLVVLAFTIGKKHITIPRMGFVKFGPKRKRKITKSRIILLISVVAGLTVFLIASVFIQSNPANRSILLLFAPVAWVVNSVIIFSLLAYYMDFTRLYLYSVLFALPLPVDIAIKQFTNLNLSLVAFAVPGIAMLIVGTVLLARFLRDYPISGQEVLDGQSGN
jgi:drug/metabolite transporter (DMT)-like permease